MEGNAQFQAVTQIDSANETIGHMLSMQNGFCIDLPLPSSDILLSLSRADRILDVGCGYGAWVIQMAQRLPNTMVIGMDIDADEIQEARGRAKAELITNTMFLVDDMRTFDQTFFKHWQFDCIHAAFIGGLFNMSYARFARQLYTLCQPNAMIIWSEMEFPLTNSFAFESLIALICKTLDALEQHCEPLNHTEISLRETLQKNDRPLIRHNFGMVPRIRHWLSRAGFSDLQLVPHYIDISAYTLAYDTFTENVRSYMEKFRPLPVTLGLIDICSLDQLITGVMRDLTSSSFCGAVFALTVYGYNR